MIKGMKTFLVVIVSILEKCRAVEFSHSREIFETNKFSDPETSASVILPTLDDETQPYAVIVLPGEYPN